MAITIDWGQKIIHVPRADMPVVQADPEIRELDLDAFRLALKDLEDSEAGEVFPDTHIHNTEITIAGITYARFITIINGYTVTFEDGQYAVNAVGANSNLLDVKNANQVSLRSNNSAGLTADPATGFFGHMIDGGLDFISTQRVILAALAGKLAGAQPGSTEVTIKQANGSKVRITATVDEYGNRTAITIDATE